MIYVNGIEVQFQSFPNGEKTFDGNNLLQKLFGVGVDVLKDPEKVAMLVTSDNVNLTFKYENDGSLIELYFVKKYLDPFIKNMNLLLMYMPYSRMDRVEINNPLSVKYVAEFINSLDFKKVVVIEPHSDVTSALLNNVSVFNITTAHLLPLAIKETGFDIEKDYVIFPDAGASKRYCKSVKVNNVAYGDKSRNFKTGEINRLNLIGFNPEGVDNVIILDDLISFGGTYVRTIEELVESGYKGKVYIVAAHCEDAIYLGDLLKDKVPLDKVYTTNSITSVNNHLFKMCANNNIMNITNFGGII